MENKIEEIERVLEETSSKLNKILKECKEQGLEQEFKTKFEDLGSNFKIGKLGVYRESGTMRDLGL